MMSNSTVAVKEYKYVRVNDKGGVSLYLDGRQIGIDCGMADTIGSELKEAHLMQDLIQDPDRIYVARH